MTKGINISLADNSHEISSLIFLKTKPKKKQQSECHLCSCTWCLAFTSLWAHSADDKLVIFFLLFPENRI